MSKLFYYQLNITDIKKEIRKLELLKKNNFLIIGIEITKEDFYDYCDILIDPQHNMNKNYSKITTIEYVYNNHQEIISTIKNYSKTIFITIKSDIDSIASMALLSMLIAPDFRLDGDVILRLIAIAKSDKHGRENWKTRKNDYFKFENHNPYGLPYGVPYMCSYYKIKTSEKVKKIKEYLKTGEFNDLDKYNELVEKNLKKSIKDTETDIIVNKKLVYVKSKHRGATSKGYQVAPVVIAHNPSFNFGKGNSKTKGQKYTIAQYDNGFIDLDKVLNEILLLEDGWGGSSILIGSPQDRPSDLAIDQLINITKKHLL